MFNVHTRFLGFFQHVLWIKDTLQGLVVLVGLVGLAVLVGLVGLVCLVGLVFFVIISWSALGAFVRVRAHIMARRPLCSVRHRTSRPPSYVLHIV